MPKETPASGFDAASDTGLEFERYVHSPAGIGRRSRSPERRSETYEEPVALATVAGTSRPSWLPAATTVPAGNPRTWRLGAAVVSVMVGVLATGLGMHVGFRAVAVSPVVIQPDLASERAPAVAEEAVMPSPEPAPDAVPAAPAPPPVPTPPAPTAPAPAAFMPAAPMSPAPMTLAPVSAPPASEMALPGTSGGAMR